MTNISEILSGKWDAGAKPKDIFKAHIESEPSAYVESIMAGLKSGNRRVENGCAELASLMAAATPQLLYRYFEDFAKNLKAKEPVLRWEAACTIGSLAGVDKAKKILPLIPDLKNLLREKSIVLQGHAVRALAKIAEENPKSAPDIFETLLRSKAGFPGDRIGYIIEAMESFFGEKAFEKKIKVFAKEHMDSDFGSVATKAKKVIRAIERAESLRGKTKQRSKK